MATTPPPSPPVRWGEQVTVRGHIDAVATEARAFAAAARRGGLDVWIPTCPEWTMRDLVRHLGEIHLWAASLVDRRTAKLWPDDLTEIGTSWPDLAVFWPDDAELVDWYLETNANLVRVLRAAPADLSVPTFLPAPSPLSMWARRQAHETAVHRFDAENAVGATSVYEPVFAADGVYELLYGFVPRSDATPTGADTLLHVRALDTGDDWALRIGKDGVAPVGAHEAADLTLVGAAADLYLLLWNRGDDTSVEMAGDRGVLERWHTDNRVRWGLD